MDTIKQTLLSNIRRCNNYMQLRKLYDLIWDKTGGDRELLNCWAVRESTHNGTMSKKEWLSQISLSYSDTNGETMVLSESGDHPIYLRESVAPLVYLALSDLYDYTNGR